MINPDIIDKMDTHEGKAELDPEMLAEFENGKDENED